MHNASGFRRALGVLCLIFGLQACASVPPEVVELSALNGRDLVAVQSSYQTLIHEFYNQLRARRIDYLENTWTPAYIKDWIKEGKLREVAAGKVVWSDTAGSDGGFVRSSTVDDKEGMLLDTIHGWADAAVFDIGAKRKQLLDPLDKEETNLRKEVGLAFANLIRANAVTTAYLNSLVEVKEAQDQMLEAFDLKETRDNINSALIQASDTAAEGLDKIKEADDMVDSLSNKVRASDKD